MNAAAPTALPPTTNVSGRAQTRRELKRGAFLNAAAMLASNFRAIFTLLIARLLGPIALGIFSVAWATTDLVSKIGMCGLDDAVMTFVARAEAAGDRLGSRFLFQLANIVAVGQSTIVALILSLGVRKIGPAIGLQPEMNSAFAVIVWALPGIALYRTSTAVSRGVKVMQHDIYSRGITEPAITTVAFLIALAAGSSTFAPEVAAIVGSIAAGIVAFILASRLFRHLPASGHRRVRQKAKELLSYALPIGADQFLNAFIWRVDVIILGLFVGRAPGVTLTTLGIYGAVVGLANGLRRVSQPFTPIFTPVVAAMTATGEHREAAATYARLLQWVLWILLPFTAVMIIAGNTILMVYGPAFQQGGQWLAVVAVACATNAFINLGETVIMVQRPGLNLLNSLITAAAGATATFYLIARLGVMGAAFGILITYAIQGAIRTAILRIVFRWGNPWKEIRPVIFAAMLAIIPAVIWRLCFPGIVGQIGGALLCLGLFAGSWFYYRRIQNQIG
jgi:O-antigen/teichoic acid export membrane protein